MLYFICVLVLRMCVVIEWNVVISWMLGLRCLCVLVVVLFVVGSCICMILGGISGIVVLIMMVLLMCGVICFSVLFCEV